VTDAEFEAFRATHRETCHGRCPACDLLARIARLEQGRTRCEHGTAKCRAEDPHEPVDCYSDGAKTMPDQDPVELARDVLANSPALLLCSVCSRPAVCFCYDGECEERLECFCDEHCGHGGEDGHCAPIGELVTEMSAVIRRNARLQEALEQHGDHKAWCPSADRATAGRACKCGYQAALEGTEESDGK